jgi:hypothetical protein
LALPKEQALARHARRMAVPSAPQTWPKFFKILKANSLYFTEHLERNRDG